MTEDERRMEPTTDQAPAGEDQPAASPPKETVATKDPDDALEEPDKTDMNAVGDDGQVFGG